MLLLIIPHSEPSDYLITFMVVPSPCGNRGGTGSAPAATGLFSQWGLEWPHVGDESRAPGAEWGWLVGSAGTECVKGADKAGAESGAGASPRAAQAERAC